MNTPNFSSILDQQVDAVEKPKPLPVGTYMVLWDGMPVFGKSKQKQTDFVEFTPKFLQAMDDVDQAALAESLKGKSLQEKKVRPLTFYLTEDAVYRLDEFCIEHCGIDKGLSRKQMISMVPGRQTLVHITHAPSDDGTQIYANIKSTAKV